jgi:DHA1 family inner membrane transport protein
LFVGTLVLVGLSNMLAAFAPNIWVMAIARIVPAFLLPVFWSLASETAVDLIGPERAGRAISTVALGIVCATVFGIPIGALISDALGWRSAFGILAVVAFGKALMLVALFPAVRVKKQRISVMQQFRILRDPLMAGHVLLSVLVFTGMFTAYTYLADILERLAGFNGTLIGWSLMAFGAIGVIGNSLGGRMVDRNPLAASMIFSTLMAIGMLTLVPSMSSHLGLIAALGMWGISQAALFIVCHVRLMKAAPQAPAFGASLNISGANLGIGLGALVGGHVIDSAGVASLGLAGAAIVGLSVVLALTMMPVRPRAVQ